MATVSPLSDRCGGGLLGATINRATAPATAQTGCRQASRVGGTECAPMDTELRCGQPSGC